MMNKSVQSGSEKKSTIWLDSCPFCGGKARIRGEKFYQPNVRRNVICTECYANSGWFRTPEEAAEAWNRRFEHKEE